MDRIAIPYGVSIEGFLDVLGAWNRARGFDRPLKNKEVGSRIRSNAKLESKEKVVSNQSTFLIQIGILKKEGNTNRLTDIGHVIARAIDFGLMDEFIDKMWNQLWQWPEGAPLFNYLYFRGQVEEKILLERIVAEAGKSMSTTNASMGSKTLVELFLRIHILERSGDALKMTDAARTRFKELRNF